MIQILCIFEDCYFSNYSLIFFCLYDYLLIDNCNELFFFMLIQISLTFILTRMYFWYLSNLLHASVTLDHDTLREKAFNSRNKEQVFHFLLFFCFSEWIINRKIMYYDSLSKILEILPKKKKKKLSKPVWIKFIILYHIYFGNLFHIYILDDGDLRKLLKKYY